MGLCLGFSFLSFVEIIYFLTLRPLVNYCNLKKKLKKVDPNRTLGQNPDYTNNSGYQYYK